ncbi:hypothetical protein KAR48_15015 [bacterium]|nr:hypothetical protein [bacterium]
MIPTFSDPLSQKLWDGYFNRVKRIMRRTPYNIREEMLHELQGHLAESISESRAQREPDCVQEAIERLGDPEDYLKPMITERLLDHASGNYSLRSVILAFIYSFSSGLSRFIISLILSLGYITAFTLGLTGIANIFIPDKAGLFISPNEFPSLGIINNPSLYGTDILGFWFTPLSIIIAILMYMGLTRLWRRLIRKAS